MSTDSFIHANNRASKTTFICSTTQNREKRLIIYGFSGPCPSSSAIAPAPPRVSIRARERDLERNKFRVFRLHFVGSIIPFQKLSTLLSANKASRCDLFRFWVQKRYTLFFRRAISVERLTHTYCIVYLYARPKPILLRMVLVYFLKD